MKKIKSKTYQICYKRFVDYAYNNFGRLETRISLLSFAKWMDWREGNPQKEFYRFERFLW